MRNFIATIVLLLAASIAAIAQSGTTVVTATVADSKGNLYVNCQWSAVFVGENTTPGAGPYAPAPLLNGQQGTCTSLGTFSVNLADNINTVTPGPSQWNFSICSASGYVAGPYCRSNILVTITGATMDLTSILTPLMPILPPSGNGVPVVFNGAPTGSCVQTQTAVNSLTGDYYSCSGGTWVKVGPGTGGGGGGGGGTTPPGGSAFQIQTNVGGTNFGGLSNAAKGSALVSQGVSAFPTMQTKPLYDIRDQGFVCDGTTDNSPAASTLVNAINGANATVQITQAHCGINNFVWPANITLDFAPGGTLKPLTDSTTTPGTATFDSTAGAIGNCKSDNTTTTCAMSVTAPANDTYALVCMRGFSSGLPTFTSSVNTDVIVPLLSSSPNFFSVVTSAMVPNVTAGARTFTATFPANLVGACTAVPITGLGPTPSLDGAGFIGSNVSAATTMTGSASFQSGSFLLAFGGNNSTAETCTQTGTFTLISGAPGCSTNTASNLAVAYLNSASAGSNTGAVGISTPPSHYWSWIVLGLRPGSATEYIRGGINNPLKAQIFENATSPNGAIDFTYNTVNFDVYPEWWGAGGSASATTNTGALQAAEHGAFGTGRTNGSGLSQYNKPLVLDQDFQINGELKFYDVLNFKVRCDRRLTGGITQTASNLRIIDGQSVAYGSFDDCLWQGTASNTGALIDLDYNGITTSGDLAPQFIDFNRNTFNGNNLVATGMLLSKSGGAAQGSNVYCWNCEGESFTFAVWSIGTQTVGATNAIDDGWYGGDMEGNPQYGLFSNAGGHIFLDHTTMENGFSATLGPDNQLGFDMYCQNQIGQEPCEMISVRSESRRLISAGIGYVRNSYTVDQSAYPTPGTSQPVGTIVKGSVVGGDGQYYKVTVDASAFSGAGAPTALLNASGGSSTTLNDTNYTVAGATTNGGTTGPTPGFFNIGETVTQATSGSTATLINQPQSTATVTGSVTSGTFTASENLVQTTTGATGVLDGTVTGSNNMLVFRMAGSYDGTHTWVGQTSGAVYTPTGLPTFAAAVPTMLITTPTGSPDATHAWTGGTSGAVYTPSGAPTAQVNWTTNAFNGQRVSIMGGTGVGCYGVVTSNTATQLTFTAGFVGVYNGLACTTPDTTSTFLVEPGWNGGTVVSGGITMVALNEKAIDGSNGNAGMQGILENVTIPGELVNIAPTAYVKNLQVTRPDWLPSAGGGWWAVENNHDWDVHLTQFVASNTNTYYRNWKFSGPTLPTLFNGPQQRNLGTVPLIWSCGYGGGLSNVCNDVWIGGRSDPFGTTSASRSVLEFGGILGRATPTGVNQNGTATQIQGGLPTGSGTPGAIEFWSAPGGGSSGSAVQTGAKVASVDKNGFEGPIGGTTPAAGTFTTLSVVSCTGCGGGGTVTNTGGALTANAVVLGAGSSDTKVSTGITSNGASELDLGVNGTASGVLGLNGSTSGKATLTAPAVAGTTTNAVVSSNWLQAPDFEGAIGTGTPAAGIFSAVTDNTLTVGNCVQATTGGLLTTASGPCGTSTGTITATGTPASGNLTKFSGATSITNGDLSGDVTTSGTLATEVVGLLNTSLPALAPGCLNSTGTVWQYVACITSLVSPGPIGGTTPSTGAFTTLTSNGNSVRVAIATGSKALNTNLILSGACDDTTVTVSGVATTDVITATFNADVTGVVGYIPSTSGNLTIYIFPTANTLNFKVCNPTSSSITPGFVTLNYQVSR